MQIVLDRTPFYAESGGQVGDVGLLTNGASRFRVTDTKKLGDAHLHIGTVEAGSFRKGDIVTAQVDAATRQSTVLNHSATHLLHAALRKVLGNHVTQKGSLVAPDRLRFDFSHTQPVSPEELDTIERLVNAEIRANRAAEIRQLPYDAAIKSGAMALFGEKYGDEVRVLKFGDFSTELCGGTHVARTGDIGFFKITSEGGIASGIRRIEAVTGEGALEAVKATDATLKRVAASLRAAPAELEGKVAQLLEQQKKLEREMAALRSKLATGGGGTDIAAQAVTVNGVSVLAVSLDGADAETLRSAADQFKSRFESAVIVLGSAADGKVMLVASVTPALSKTVSAGKLIGELAQMVGGKGGGRPDFAQAGGNDPSKLADALRAVTETRRRQTRRNLTPGCRSEVTWDFSRCRFWCCSPGPSHSPALTTALSCRRPLGRLSSSPSRSNPWPSSRRNRAMSRPRASTRSAASGRRSRSTARGRFASCLQPGRAIPP